MRSEAYAQLSTTLLYFVTETYLAIGGQCSAQHFYHSSSILHCQRSWCCTSLPTAAQQQQLQQCNWPLSFRRHFFCQQRLHCCCCQHYSSSASCSSTNTGSTSSSSASSSTSCCNDCILEAQQSQIAFSSGESNSSCSRYWRVRALFQAQLCNGCCCTL
jgi:hypothetical protein